jgi:hypothetical protein
MAFVAKTATIKAQKFIYARKPDNDIAYNNFLLDDSFCPLLWGYREILSQTVFNTFILWRVVEREYIKVQ